MIRQVIRDSRLLCGWPDKGFTEKHLRRQRLCPRYKRCVVSKAPEPEARATLISMATSAALELVCIDSGQQKILRTSLLMS